MDESDTVEILLAEDSDADAEMIIRSLRKGNVVNRVMRVHDGVEAIDYIFREGKFAHRTSANPRLILLDLKMPRLGGIEVLRRIKADENMRVVPIVMLTSSAEDKDIQASYSFGVNSYLVKPVNFTEFAQVIAQVGLYWAVMNKLPS